MNVVAGIGWITQREYGCVMTALRRSYSDMKSLRSKLQDESILLYPAKSFGKYDRVSKMTCCAAALAFYDAGMSYSEDRKQDIGILGSNSDGCLQSNVVFFRDFVENGRTLGRANLFVYTLPSIPMAEAAIYYRCQGPLLYMTFPGRPIASLLRHSDKMIRRGESAAMLAVKASEDDAQCFFLRREGHVSGGSAMALEEVAEVSEREATGAQMIESLTKRQHAENEYSLRREDPSARTRP